MDILERIDELLQEKFQGKQKLLADKLGKTESEVSKWLNGVQNFTIKTLMKLQVAFGEPIIVVCTNEDKSTFQQVKLSSTKKQTYCEVAENGDFYEGERVYTQLKSVQNISKEK